MTITRSPITQAWRHITVTLATAVLAVLAVLAVTTLSAARASAGATSPTETKNVKPTIVFVHGAFADSSGWDSEITAVERLGYPAIAAADPLTGLISDADYVRSVLRTIAGPIVLVGHSYGGAVITNAAMGVPNVKALVFVGAFLPAKGEATGTMLDPAKYPGSLLTPDNLLLRPFANPWAPGGKDLDVYINPTKFRAAFAADVSAREAARLAATQRPLSLFANTQKSGTPAWKSVPSWDLITLDDRAIPPAGQLFMARRAHAHTRSVHSAHDVMISHPKAVTQIVLAAAHAVR